MPEETSGSDTLLRDQLLAGDEVAFESLLSANHGAMLRFARNVISRPDVAEEVVQETWLAVSPTAAHRRPARVPGRAA